MFPRGGSPFFHDSTINLTVLEVSAVVVATFGLLSVFMILVCAGDGFSITQFVLFGVAMLVFFLGFVVAVGMARETNRIQDDMYCIPLREMDAC